MDKQYLDTFSHGGVEYTFVSLERALPQGIKLSSLPFSKRVLLENVLRTAPEGAEKEQTLKAILGVSGSREEGTELRFYPSRVLMHDFTIPALMDLAAMREAVAALGGDPALINPLIPVAVTIDHSVQVDHYGTSESMELNSREEYRLNSERIALLKWANGAMDNLTVVPPAKGICHQLQLERFSRVFMHKKQADGRELAFPDSMVGADSHTGTLGGIGVIAYGIGGIEIETIMMGEPSVMPLPEVVGVRLAGKLRPHVTATDLALAVTALLRKEGVVEKFVEFTGPGVDSLSIPARCTVANMAPEYGATLGYFAIDAKVIEYLRITGRPEQAAFAEAAARASGQFREHGEEPAFSHCLDFDLDTVEPCISGPARPQQHIPLKNSKEHISNLLANEKPAQVQVAMPPGSGRNFTLRHGDIALASITSCTNTINPELMIGAGLLARKAVKKGLKVPEYVKTVLAPGSTTVTRYLKDAGLQCYLEALGFHTVGYSCLTCIGNSGPLPAPVAGAIRDHGLNMAAVLSANRNFSGRVHAQIKSNFLASPMLVVAFALSGSMLTDMEKDPVGHTPEGEAVYLKDILPSDEEIARVYAEVIRPEVFAEEYARLDEGGPLWDGIKTATAPSYIWDENSTYIKRPPYFDGLGLEPEPLPDIRNARVLGKFGDAVTTDHISPAGSIPPEYPAGKYLLDHGVDRKDFNTYGNRRGNHELMVRGTLGNIRLVNQLVTPREGSFTRKFPEGGEMFIFDASEAYRKEGVPLIILAGKEYGTGSSRDWAAKGVYFLGVKAVIAQSFERIHRSNLVGMGILPLQFKEGDSADGLGLTGEETYTLSGLNDVGATGDVEVAATKADGSVRRFNAKARLDTPSELACFKNGGILPYVMRKLVRRGSR